MPQTAGRWIATNGTSSVPLKVDPTDGALIVKSDTGGDAVTLAAGSVAAGAYVAGSLLDGADATQGLKADAAWTTGAGSIVALLKAIAAKAISFIGVKMAGLKYVTCAASTTQALGTGAIGDTLNTLLIVPTTTAAGNVQIKDGSGAAVTVFTGGGTLGDLKPFTVALNAVSAVGGWSIVTGANVTAVAAGQFTP